MWQHLNSTLCKHRGPSWKKKAKSCEVMTGIFEKKMNSFLRLSKIFKDCEQYNLWVFGLRWDLTWFNIPLRRKNEQIYFKNNQSLSGMLSGCFLLHFIVRASYHLVFPRWKEHRCLSTVYLMNCIHSDYSGCLSLQCWVEVKSLGNFQKVFLQRKSLSLDFSYLLPVIIMGFQSAWMMFALGTPSWHFLLYVPWALFIWRPGRDGWRWFLQDHLYTLMKALYSF